MPSKNLLQATKAPGFGRILSETPRMVAGLAGLLPQLQGRKIAITDSGSQVGSELVGILRNKGIEAELVHSVSAKYDGVIFLGALRHFTTQESAFRINREGLLIAKNLQEKFKATGGIFAVVSSGDGRFGYANPESSPILFSGLPALLNTLSEQYPDVAVKAIDIETGLRRSIDLARDIADELLNGGPEKEVGFSHDGRRWLRQLGAMKQHLQTEFKLAPDSVVLVYLHKDDLGPALAKKIASQGVKAIVLIEAKGKKSDRSAIVAEIESLGVSCRYVAIDGFDLRHVSKSLDGVRQAFGKITGLVYTSGLMTGHTLGDCIIENFDLNLEEQITPLLHLLRCLKRDSLSLLATVSSFDKGAQPAVDQEMLHEILAQIAVRQRTQGFPDALVKAVALRRTEQALSFEKEAQLVWDEVSLGGSRIEVLF